MTNCRVQGELSSSADSTVTCQSGVLVQAFHHCLGVSLLLMEQEEDSSGLWEVNLSFGTAALPLLTADVSER